MKLRQVNGKKKVSNSLTKKQAEFEIVENPYEDKLSKGRIGLMVKGSWDNSLYDVIKSKNIKALYFNSARGWRDTDYSFLKSLENIEELNIIAASSVNLEAIELMSRLKELSITTTTRSNIDFSKLPTLEKCFLSWWPEAKNIFNAPALKELYLDGMKFKDFSILASLDSLRKLTLANCNVENIDFLISLTRLVHLELLNCRKIRNFTPISKLSKLEWLHIGGTKNISSIDFIAALKNLEVLLLTDVSDIATLKPVSKLLSLKALGMPGSKTNIIDGDLSCLTKLPRLAMLMFAPRKHYSHTLIKTWDWSNFDKPDRLLEEK